jgi:hypothetical protein
MPAHSFVGGKVDPDAVAGPAVKTDSTKLGLEPRGELLGEVLGIRRRLLNHPPKPR